MKTSQAEKIIDRASELAGKVAKDYQNQVQERLSTLEKQNQINFLNNELAPVVGILEKLNPELTNRESLLRKMVCSDEIAEIEASFLWWFPFYKHIHNKYKTFLIDIKPYEELPLRSDVLQDMWQYERLKSLSAFDEEYSLIDSHFYNLSYIIPIAFSNYTESKRDYIKLKLEELNRSISARGFEVTDLNYISMLSNLRRKLIKHGFIPDTISLPIFNAVFTGKEVSQPITWLTNKTDLAYFISELIKKRHGTYRVIKNPKNKHWQIAANCFVKQDGYSRWHFTDFKRLHDPNADSQDKLNDAISVFSA